jgi:C1A family cysteine protease
MVVQITQFEDYTGAFLVRNSWGQNWGVASDGITTAAYDPRDACRPY